MIKPPGKIRVIGIGAGTRDSLTLEAWQAIKESDVIIGYKTYIELIRHLLAGKQVISSGMKKEIDRCVMAMNLAENGLTVALISSGDPGIYGMAGVMLEIVNQGKKDIPVQVIPGLSAANIAAAVLGAPLMHDFAVISLSDLLTPWEKIQKRLELCAQADMIICLYNPRSHGRTKQIVHAQEILSTYKPPQTPAGIVKNAGRAHQEVFLTDLQSMLTIDIDMSTIVIIGNDSTYIDQGKMITPRGYQL